MAKRFRSFFWKAVRKAMKWCFIAFCFFLASLLFRQQRLPGAWVASLARSLSVPGSLDVRIAGISVGLPKGVRFEGLRVFDLGRKDPGNPAASVEELCVHPLSRRVKAVGVSVPRLGDSYYEPGYPDGGPDLSFRLPRLPRFELELERPDIIGVRPRRVWGRAEVKPRSVKISGIRLEWNGPGRGRVLDGQLSVDLARARLLADVRGHATQEPIRPMMVLLDIPVAMPYYDAFTEVPEPVPSSMSLDVDLRTCGYVLELGLHPKLGRYNSVPMSRADGTLRVKIGFHGGHMDYETSVSGLTAFDADGRLLDGELSVSGTEADDAAVRVKAVSELKLKDALAIAGFLDDGSLDCLVCDTAPKISVEGVVHPDVPRMHENDLSGNMSFARGSFFGAPLSDAAFKFAYRGDVVTISEASATCRTGGKVSGSGRIDTHMIDGGEPSFRLDVSYRDGSLEELADLLEFDLGERTGRVSGELHLSGPLKADCLPGLCGSGSVAVADGRIAQMRLFMGLTTVLADKVPGVATIVNQSQASCDFTITNGVFKTDNLLVEGALFSISAAGAYDMAADDLDFKVNVKFMKSDSVLGQLFVRPVTWPFTKLLLQFRLSGKLEDPRWKYVTILDKML